MEAVVAFLEKFEGILDIEVSRFIDLNCCFDKSKIHVGFFSGDVEFEQLMPVFDIIVKRKIPVRLIVIKCEFNIKFLRYVLRYFNLKQYKMTGNYSSIKVNSVPVLDYCKCLTDETSKFWSINIDKDSGFLAPALCFEMSGYEILVWIKLHRSEKKIDDEIIFELIKQDLVLFKKSCFLPHTTNRVDIMLSNETLTITNLFDNRADNYMILEEPRVYRLYEIFDPLKLDCIIVHGLALCRGHWNNFCGRGLYDPRLFLLIGEFNGLGEAKKQKVATVDMIEGDGMKR